MNTRDAVIGRWPEVFKAFGMPPVTGLKHWAKECPVCNRKGKFRIDDKEGRGTWICSCGSGDGWKLLELTQQKTIGELFAEVDQIIGNVWQRDASAPQRQKQPAPVDQVRDAVLRKFSGDAGAARHASTGLSQQQGDIHAAHTGRSQILYESASARWRHVSGDMVTGNRQQNEPVLSPPHATGR